MVRCRVSRARQGETPRMKLWRNLTDWLHSIRPNPVRGLPTKQIPPDAGGRPLRLRLLFWIIIWLLPAAFVSIVQGVDRVQRDVNDVRERLIQTAQTTASDEETLLTSGSQVLRAVANQPEVRAGTDGCGPSLVNALKGLTYITNILRFDAQGNALCLARRGTVNQDNATGRVWWPEALKRTDFFITPQAYSTVAQTDVLGGVLPLRTAAGQFDGVIALTLDVSWLDVLLHTRPIPAGAVVGVFDPAGKLIVANDASVARQIFANNPKKLPPNALLSASVDGGSWSYVLVPLLNNPTS